MNVFRPTSVTNLGIVIDDNDVLWKQPPPILFNDESSILLNETSVRLVQYRNALIPNSVTELGIVIDDNDAF